MEWQVPPPQATDESQYHPPQGPLPLPPGGHDVDRNTYIVQFPREQVYYVPPPENALFLERQRNSPNEEKKSRCRPRLFAIALLLLAMVAILGITYAALYFIFTPTAPSFSVTNFVVLLHKHSSPRPRYQITLTANNPNSRSRLEYEKNGDVSLLFEKNTVATARFPWLEQEPDASANVTVELRGSNGHMPRQMEKSMKDSKSKTPISFDLEMRLGVRIKPWGLNLWVMDPNVSCKFKVSTLRNDSRLLSQQCTTNS